MVQFCSNSFDLNNDTRHIEQKIQRLKYLQQLVGYLGEQNYVLSVIVPHIDLIIQMIEKNIFRPLPVLMKAGAPIQGVKMEDEQFLVDPAWRHLQPVYQLFLKVIANEAVDVKILKVFITSTFIQQFIQLFDSQEPKERQSLKLILYRLYAKLVPRRKMIRKVINDCFYSLIHENFKFNGASELLDILASIISGFAIPYRQENIIFFKTVIIPLHKVQSNSSFHDQLIRCSMLFLTKDPSLALFLLQGLLKFWPLANYRKEIMFIIELSEVLQVCEVRKLESHIPKLFNRLIKCITGEHLYVVDTVINLFQHDFFLNILKTYKNYTFPLLVPVICYMAQTHWYKSLQESLNALKSILREIDFQAFQNSLQKKNTNKYFLRISQDPKILERQQSKLQDKWKILLWMAQQKNPTLEQPVLPYIKTHIVGDYNGINNGNVNVL